MCYTNGVSTIFARIIRGEIPCHKLLESDRYLSFLDVRPVKSGHALVIPKREVDYLFDLEDRELGDIMAFAKKVAAAIRMAIPCKKVGIMVAGLEVPHAHIHLIPIDAVKDLSFAHARSVSAEELAETAQKIIRCL